MNQPLRECPGCGGKAFGPYGPHPDGHQSNMRAFECDSQSCPIYFFDSTDDADAIRQWNIRASQQPAPAQEVTAADYERAMAEEIEFFSDMTPAALTIRHLIARVTTRAQSIALSRGEKGEK